MSEQRYSLKAGCESCGQYGRIDDRTLVCACGAEHKITAAEQCQLDADIALQAQARRVRLFSARSDRSILPQS